jgi:hypothetical protein
LSVWVLLAALKPCNMRILLFLQIFFISVLLIGSCDGTPCGRGDLAFGLVGFSDQESDTIILRSFTKSNTGQVLRDTLLLNSERVGWRRRSDTLTFSYADVGIFLVSDYNYEIFLPDPGTLFTVTDIKEDFNSQSPGCGKKPFCINPLTGYTLNGQPVTHNGYEPLYLVK